MFYNDTRMTNNMLVSPNIYTPAPMNPGYAILPSDGDPFVDKSANNFEIQIYNTDMMMLETAIKNPTLSGIKATSTDGTTITISPFVCIMNFGSLWYIHRQEVPITISAANLVPAGSFAATTRYYVYAKLTVVLGVGTVSLVISTDVPHTYLLYRDNAGAQDFSMKFLFSFYTDSTGKIIPFIKQNHRVMFLKSTTETHVVVDGVAAAYTAITLGNVIPSYSNIIKLKVEFYNGETTVVNQCLFEIDSVPAVAQVGVGIDGNVVPTSIVTTFLDINKSGLKYKILSPGAMATPSKVNINVVGYYE
ncbi:MAG: hypothetical protein E6R13_00815 [Spirochaetes bacterium]|nr:MAG: hypothetical protein E6R13_00815 [Spirochaetota bacterium]